MDNIKIIEKTDEGDLAVFDASDMSPDQVLAQIEHSMANMDAKNQKRIVFTNDGETFDDVIEKL